MSVEEFKDAFIEEAHEILEGLNDFLLKLEKDPRNADLLENMMRGAHTMKGMAATMGYKNMTELTHRMEDLFIGFMRGGLFAITSATTLFSCLDRLQEMVRKVEEDSNPDIVPIGQAIDELATHLPQAVPEIDLGRKFAIQVRFNPESTLKTVRAFMVISNLEAVASIHQSNPTKAELEEGASVDEFYIEVFSKEDSEDLVAAVKTIADVASVDISQLADTMVDTAEAAIGRRTITSVRVNVGLLDDALDLLGELVINKSKSEAVAEKHGIREMNNVLLDQASLVNDLQNLVLRMRLVPLEILMNRFPRVVRDVAAQENKDIELILTGTQIQMDRAIIDELYEPLMHIVRNAAYHGIEDASKRKKSKKPAQGVIRMMAQRQQNSIVLTLEDDGGGIDMRSIKKALVQQGRYKTQKEITDREALDAIFEPGFSTSDSVDTISGRGYGLNIAREKVVKLGGSLDVESTSGSGTKFTFVLPMTKTIRKALLVAVNDDIYAVPMDEILRIVDADPSRRKEVEGREYVVVGGDPYPLIDLRKALPQVNKRNLGTRGESLLNPVVVAQRAGKSRALVVDNVLGQTDIVTKELDPILAAVPGYAGLTFLGDGSVILILDPFNLAEVAE